jgi:hypothetical protein
MGRKRSEINNHTFFGLPQALGLSKDLLATEADFFASLTN